jgi:hypothetical protein
MSKINRFESPKQRLRRGKAHISRLKKRVAAWMKKIPYATVIELDADGVTQLHKVKLTKPMPVACNDSAIEALEAIRSALDQTGYAAAVAAGRINPTKTAFPISSSASELDNLIVGRRVCEHIPDEIVALFRTFNPYKGGNDPIYVLNKLRNKTHTKLAPVGFVYGGLLLANFEADGGVHIPSPVWDPDKNEMIYARVQPGAKFKYNGKFRFNITFDDPGLMDGKAVAMVVLDMAADQVAKIIRATEAKCKELGFVA